MRDNQPQDAGDSLEHMEAADTREGFAQLLRLLFARAGRSTNDFEAAHGFKDGTVSKHQTGKTVPPLAFVEALLNDVRMRNGLTDDAEHEILNAYGRLLRRLNQDGTAHNLHKVMLQLYECKTALRTLTGAISATLHELVGVQEELSRIREAQQAGESADRGRKEELDTRHQQLAARQSELVAQREATVGDLNTYEQQYRQLAERDGSYPFRTSHALGGDHVPPALPAVGDHAPRPPRGRSPLTQVLVATVVLVLGIFLIHRLTEPDPGTTTDGRGDPANTAGRNESPGTTPPTRAGAGGPPADSDTPGPTESPGEAPASRPPASPRYLADLNATGDAWAQGTWYLGGTRHDHSLAWTRPCNDGEQWVVFALPGSYRRLTATVGVSDYANDIDKGETAHFRVYADANHDGEPQGSEQISSRAALYGKPGRIDAQLQGATQIILLTESPQDCLLSPAVWGDPRVS
ncbi:NPCBM/NEW2 domain-containing protein [Streptomyces sp. DSM 40750]|uniref:NPCBM/NEW2 domain-containing protein n=1 Tax=Streptomyces sp. DSM 40750 TaxID=2801030 RepID=UPI00214B6513|nr:NPCBM/NEW2 domain-containing protein [Streptomyces sp. DSM 40750]UUU22915.1 NPCBM/NEW2 domain-containing protein [Streptomyces sp. DSM 40750]